MIATNATEATKIRSIVRIVPDKNCHQKTRKPPERHLRGLLGSSIGYIRQFNDTARAISPQNPVRYVAAVRRKRDLIPPESGGQTARVCANRLVAASSIACALACTSEISSSISAPFNVRLMRSTMDNAITTSPKGINKSRAATSQCAMNSRRHPRASRSTLPARAPAGDHRQAEQVRRPVG